MRLVTFKQEAAPPITVEHFTPLSPWMLEAGKERGGRRSGTTTMVAKCISLIRFHLPNRDCHAPFHEKGVLQRSSSKGSRTYH